MPAPYHAPTVGMIESVHEERTDDGGDDGAGADEQREAEPVGDACGTEGEATEQHGGHGRDDIGLEEVGSHTGAVTDVVTDVVGDDGGVAGVVLGDTRLDLADEVGADVSGLGEDTAAETGEDRDQGATEAQADERGLRGDTREHEEGHDGDGKDTETDDEHTGDGTGLERDPEGRAKSLAGSLSRTYVGAHGDAHADETGGTGGETTDEEPECGPGAEARDPEETRYQQDDGDDDGCMVSLPAGSLLIPAMRMQAKIAATIPAPSPRIRGSVSITPPSSSSL